MWFELYLTFSYEFNSHIPFHDLFELNGVSFSVQTPEVSQMSTTDPATHHFGQTSTGNYEANLARMKGDLADMLKEKLGFVSGNSRLYRRLYVDAFDLIPYPASWCAPNFVKFSGDDN